LFAMACIEATPARRASGRRGTRSKAASVGHKLLGVALPASLRPQRRRRSQPQSAKPPGGGLRRGIGEVQVPFPAADDAWVERLRDLARSAHGGSVLIAGRHRLRPAAEGSAEVGQEAPGLACKALLNTLRSELLAQGFGLSAAGHVEPLARGCEGNVESPDDVEQVDLRVLWELTRQVIAHVSVTPGLHVAEEAGLPPVLWQPLFLICVGCGQVRVLTLAFVGGPVAGSQPNKKRTPFVLRLTTDDLVPPAALAAQGAPAVPAPSSVHFAMEPAAPGSLLMLEHVASIEEELFGAVDTGDWALMDEGFCPTADEGHLHGGPTILEA